MALTVSRLGRIARLARVGASTGLSLAVSKDGAAAAELAAGVLGELRGLAAKVGQMASYVDGMVPEAHRGSYERALSALQAKTVQSSPTAIRAILEEDLAAPTEALFSEFDETPFASASIGQVHRATLPDGRAVAVKVQHPGIERAVAADLANAGVMTSMVSALGPKALGAADAFSEIRARFTEELDYAAEAASQETFRGFHAGDHAVVVPAVVPERSGRRVLTTELVVGGLSLDDVALLPEAERRAYAEVLWRFVFRSVLVHRQFNADPHPGNYLFLPGGRVAFLDYGCVQPISVENNLGARVMHRAALDRDEAGFRRACAAFLGTEGGPFEEAAVGYVRRAFEPLFADEFTMTRGYVTELVAGMQGLKQFVFQKRSGFVPMKPGMLFMNRLQFGFYSVLARLDVAVSYAGVEERILGEAGLRRVS